MAIRGSLREASFPDVLQLLALGKKTGCLSVVDGSRFGSVFFEQGRITFAAIVDRRDRLGDALVRKGHVTQAQLDSALKRQRQEPGRRLGELLVQAGYVGGEVVQRELRVLVEEAVYSLFTWTQGTFTFEPDVTPDGRGLSAAINPESLLLEGARRVDEWQLVQKRFPTFDLVFEFDPARAHDLASLGAEVTEVAQWLDGRRDIRGMIERSGLSEFVVGRSLYDMAMQGMLVQVGAPAGGSDEHDALESPEDKAARLGRALLRAGMLEDAERELRTALAGRADDLAVRHQLGVIALRQARWPEAVEWLEPLMHSDAASVAMLHHLALAYEAVGRELDAARLLDRAARLLPEAPAQVELSRAMHAYRGGDAVRADQLLLKARTRFAGDAAPAVWFHIAALVAAARDDADRAQALLEEGIRTYPSVGVLHANYAALLLARGQVAAAGAAIERAQLHAANLAPFQKTVGDLAHRLGRYDDALEAYLRAVRIDPAIGPDTYVQLGELRFQRGEAAEAERCWQRALELDPGARQARGNLEAMKRAS
ncbi:MAG: DUF4388 domain-containing protein [Gemmatimonadaceae bacterium]|nr:DUF4388 domain-containing protein [Gemmatimonadaceae bacterium]